MAYREVPSHPDGVWFVDLSSIADENALAGAFATALQLVVAGHADANEQIATYLSTREALVVVDNCEHLIDAVAELLDGLLEASPSLRILATSRESLELEGEFTWKVPSLPTGVDAPAVELFFERAAAAGATLRRDDATVALVSDVVERLDGIPLAIELAAARARSLDVAEIRDLLDDRFRLLGGGARRSRQRQATLEGTVQWSYDLLSEEEQAMLQTLSVFQGGFALGDVGAVAGLPVHVALDLIDALASKSLVDITRDAGGHVRYRLLETIRLFALARLIDAGEAEATRDRHLEHFLSDPDGNSLEALQSLRSVERRGQEYENYRAAATWAFEQGRREATAKLAAIIAEPSVPRGEVQLAIDCLRLDAELSPEDRIMVQTYLGWTLAIQGDLLGAGDALAEALRLGEERPFDFVTFAMQADGSRISLMGDPVRCWELFLAAQAMADEHYGANTRSQAAIFVASGHISRNEMREAVALIDRALGMADEFGFRHVLEAFRAEALLFGGQIDEAARAVEAFGPVPSTSQWAHINQVMAHMVRGHTEGPDAAATSLAETVRETVSRRPLITSDVLQGFAYLARVRGDEERCQEIIDSTMPVGLDTIRHALIVTPTGLTGDAALEHLKKQAQAVSVLDVVVRDLEQRGRLFSEELARWG